jgi:multidrug efflux pump subunit AcrA (membrane-fusion protein)
MIRISLIIALLAALAVGAINFFVVKDKINTLVTDRNTNRDNYHATQAALSKTNAILVKTEATLKQTEQNLADTQAERDKAVASLATQTKRANDLSDKLVKTTQERDDAQNQLASYKTTGFTPEQVAKLGRTLKEKQDAIDAGNLEKTLLAKKIDRLQTRLQKYEGTNTVVTLRADLLGKILVVDPKWEFVVLNIGEDQGVKEDGELLVSRDGKLVAKVIVRTLEKNRSIANLVPGWKLGEVIEGDEVSPAHPSSS